MRLQRIGTPLADVVREGVRYAAPLRGVPKPESDQVRP
jgi:hypothetical protein